ncbi:MAG: 3-oxoacyl-[acyl-carrier-protein] synthase III C-terminal domain-containing protein [Planctomycetota bacterium]
MIVQAAHSPRVRSTATAFPRHSVDQAGAIAALQALFPEEDPDRVDVLVRRSGVKQRCLAVPVEETIAPTTFTDRNRVYREVALEIAQRAAAEALQRAGMAPTEIDVLVDVSCTGICIPALDVALVPLLGLRSDIKRLPITESGCAAGALALGLAADLARAGKRVLIVAVELCSLSLVPEDRTRTNLVASLLFGDGAAAAIVAPDGPGPTIEAVGSDLIPDTVGIMGFDVGSHGLRIVLERELPQVVSAYLPGAVMRFLERNGRAAADIGIHLVHPGGRKVLEAYQAAFQIDRDELRHSYGVLRDHGNLSSASILAVLDRTLAEEALRAEREALAPRDALLVAMGPGMSLELAVLRFQGAPRDERWVAPAHAAASAT